MLTTPENPACQTGTPVVTANDTATSTLTADVEVPAASLDQAAPASGAALAAQPMVLAAVAGGSARGRLDRHEAVRRVDLGTAGNTGELTWSYPIKVPDVPGGLLPEIALSYNSGSTDGKTVVENSQSSWVGEGFDLSPGFIERKYSPCSEDLPKNTVDKAKEFRGLCWGTDNAVLSMNGRGGELIYNNQDQFWHPRNDDGTRIRRVLATGFGGQFHKWIVTTPDGTEYQYGLGTDSVGQLTGSRWTVPVFGNEAGEPCYDNGTTRQARTCEQAWRWNLDYVKDPHGNEIFYYYDTELNHYTGYGQTTGNTEYVSAGYLKRIEYGSQAGVAGSHPVARVRFVRASAERDDYPSDMRCTEGEDCGESNVNPAFFERHYLSEIITDRRKADNSDWTMVDRWDLDNDDTYGGSMWLSGVKQIAEDGSGSTPTNVVRLVPDLYDTASWASTRRRRGGAARLPQAAYRRDPQRIRREDLGDLEGEGVRVRGERAACSREQHAALLPLPLDP